jgi:hypothetical protein
MTEGHHILVEPDKLQRGESIGKGAFATVYKATMKKTSDEVYIYNDYDIRFCTIASILVPL